MARRGTVHCFPGIEQFRLYQRGNTGKGGSGGAGNRLCAQPDCPVAETAEHPHHRRSSFPRSPPKPCPGWWKPPIAAATAGATGFCWKTPQLDSRKRAGLPEKPVSPAGRGHSAHVHRPDGGAPGNHPVSGSPRHCHRPVYGRAVPVTPTTTGRPPGRWFCVWLKKGRRRIALLNVSLEEDNSIKIQRELGLSGRAGGGGAFL